MFFIAGDHRSGLLEAGRQGDEGGRLESLCFQFSTRLHRNLVRAHRGSSQEHLPHPAQPLSPEAHLLQCPHPVSAANPHVLSSCSAPLADEMGTKTRLTLENQPAEEKGRSIEGRAIESNPRISVPSGRAVREQRRGQWFQRKGGGQKTT